MAAATIQLYGAYLLNTFKGDIDHDTASFKAMLVNSSYTPNMDTHDFKDDVVANEVTGTNWPAGGVAVTITLSIDATSHQLRAAVSDISVSTVTLTDGKTLVIYNNTPGSDATRHLVGYATFDTALAPTAGTLSVDFPTVTYNLDYN